MKSVNQVFLLGRLGGDAETRQIRDRVVSRFSLATDRRRKGADGKWADETLWHQVAVWSSAGEGGIAQYLTKGRVVHVQGRLETHSWVDEFAERRWRTEVVARPADVVLIWTKRSGRGPARDSERPAPAAAPPPPPDPPPGDDDIPL